MVNVGKKTSTQKTYIQCLLFNELQFKKKYKTKIITEKHKNIYMEQYLRFFNANIETIVQI